MNKLFNKALKCMDHSSDFLAGKKSSVLNTGTVDDGEMSRFNTFVGDSFNEITFGTVLGDACNQLKNVSDKY